MVLVNQNQVLQNAQILNAIRQQQQQQQGGNNLPQLDGSNEIIIDADKVKIIDRRPKKAKGANKEGTSKSKVTKKVPQLDGGGVGMSDSSSDEEEEEEDSLRRLERLQNEAGGDEEVSFILFLSFLELYYNIINLMNHIAMIENVDYS